LRIAVYPGSFDPFTSGHEHILLRACSLFDHVYITIMVNAAKRPQFTLAERKEFIHAALEPQNVQNVSIDVHEGLLVEYAKKINATHIVKGLRGPEDVAYEFQQERLNRHLYAQLDTVYLISDPVYGHISSSAVKEIGKLGGSIKGLVSDRNERKIAERLMER